MMTPENEMEQITREQQTHLTNLETMMKTNMKRLRPILIALAIALSMLAACSETAPAPPEVEADPAAGISDPSIAPEPEQKPVEAAHPIEEAASVAAEAYPIIQEDAPAVAVEQEDAPAVAVEETGKVVEADSAGLDAAATRAVISQFPLGVLTDAEASGLLYMREEEKLARDVYLTLFEQWDFQAFANIARSEQTHTDAVQRLLERYDLPDPADAQDVGEFTNADLQALYDQLIAQGSQSLPAALQVAAAIEEIDILDLQEYIGLTDKGDILQVYHSLLSGSENHLRAFVSALEKQAGAYQPQYLDQEAYDAIINASSSKGRGNG